MTSKPSSQTDADLRTRAEQAIEQMRDASRDLVHDAASWREAADKTGGPLAAMLVDDALANEKRAGALEAWADAVEAALTAAEQREQALREQGKLAAKHVRALRQTNKAHGCPRPSVFDEGGEWCMDCADRDRS